MKKFLTNKKYTEIAKYVIVTAFALMVLWRLVNSTDNLWITISNALSFIAHSFSTILAGLILGYILTPAVEGIEDIIKKIFKKKRSTKANKRIYNIAVLIVIILLVLVVVLLIKICISATYN